MLVCAHGLCIGVCVCVWLDLFICIYILPLFCRTVRLSQQLCGPRSLNADAHGQLLASDKSPRVHVHACAYVVRPQAAAARWVCILQRSSSPCVHLAPLNKLSLSPSCRVSLRVCVCESVTAALGVAHARGGVVGGVSARSLTVCV